MLGGSNVIYPVPCKTGGVHWALPTHPAKIPARSSPAGAGTILPLLWGNYSPWQAIKAGDKERGAKNKRGTNLFSSYPSCSLSLQQVWDRQGFLGTSPLGRVSLTSQHWTSSAPKLPGARPVASEKLYELFGRERVVNYHVPLLLTSANKSNYHRLMNRAQAHPRSCR